MDTSAGSAIDHPALSRPARGTGTGGRPDRERPEVSGSPAPAPEVPFGPLSALVMAVWYGLAVGLIELGLVIGQKLWRDPSPGLFRMNRHIVWTIPAVDFALFGLVGLFLVVVVRIFPRRAAWYSAGLLGGLAMLALLLSFNTLHTWACTILACGFACRCVLRTSAVLPAFRKAIRWSLPVLAAIALGLVGLSLGREVVRERWALSALPAARADAPNVLLVVLDTVRADRLSVYGYGRDTTPNLARLARRGVRFEQARATAPWTFPSHTSMMTGRWPHQTSASLHAPLDATHPTLAGYLAAHGYATAGFVANTTYTGAETGLARGFAHYEDHDLSPPAVLCTASLGRRLIWRGAVAASDRLGGHLRSDFRKNAARIGRDLLAWTERESETEGQNHRPFFAFLNFIDAHSPYLPPEGFDRHFGLTPESDADIDMLDQWFTLDKANLTPREIQLASDAYDDCLAYLDEQVGRLFDELDRRGLLDNTLVLITADHGEHFGEHELYCHASSLYDQEIHVPLLALLPGGTHAGRTVADPVSLRDLPATVADLLGLGASSPFPGQSLARCWDASAPAPAGPLPMLSEVEGPAKSMPNLGRSPAFRGAMQAVISGREVYIRNGDGIEELYDLATDPVQTRNLVRSPALLPRLETFRKDLERINRQDATRR